ncbi:MFS transporter [Prescottella defluvii]|uniref:MFS transporter n=1 Tax=Prescottella defluvii TaxID=1323361 RepID=UPI0004F285AB|nr:MFS transporter [Prescottella defluvii]
MKRGVALNETNERAAERSPWFYIRIIGSLILLSEVFAYEFNMVSPGLPEIAQEFSTKDPGLTMTVVFLASAVIVPLLAKLGDLYGKKRIILIGSTVFAVGTVMSAMATSYPLFLAGRVLMAFGLVGPVVTYGLVRDLFPPRLVPIAIGGLGVGFGASAVSGPMIGGWLIDNHGFRSVFWFLLAYVIVMGALVAFVVPESPNRTRQALDIRGAALLGAGAGALVLASSVASVRIPAVIAGIALLALFVWAQKRTAEPLISVSLLASPKLSASLLVSALISFILGANAVLMPQMLRTPTVPGVVDGMGLTAWEFALYMGLPMGVTAAVCGFLAGWFARRFGPRLGMLISAFGWTGGMAIVAMDWVESEIHAVVIGMLLGVGQGFYIASSANMIIEAVPASQQGISASMKYTLDMIFSALAAAVSGAILAAHVATVIEAKNVTIFGMDGYQSAYMVLAVTGVVTIVATLLMRHGRTPATGGVAADAVAATH